MKTQLLIRAIYIMTVAVIVSALDVVAGGFTVLAMAGMYDTGMEVYREILGKQIEYNVWNYSKWSSFMGMIDVKKYKENGTYAGASSLTPTGKPLEVLKDFEREGGSTMDIPVITPLTNDPTFGTKRMRGNEEDRKIMTKKCAVNQVRHAVRIQDNKFSKQQLKKPHVRRALMERGKRDLQDYFTRWMGFQPSWALLTGYSDNLTDSDYGLSKSSKSHPNLYVQGDNTLDFTASSGSHTAYSFDAGWETLAATALATLTNTSADFFSTTSIENMCFLANQHKIPKVKIGDKEVWLIWIHPAQARQLKADSTWQDAQKYANVRGMDNPALSGIVQGHYYDEAFIVIDETIPAARVSGDTGYSSDYGTVNYLRSSYMASPRDSGARKPALLVGGSAVAVGYGDELGYETETDDYKQFLGDEASMIVGFERCDIMDDDGYLRTAGYLYENTSSLGYFTYSPDQITL